MKCDKLKAEPMIINDDYTALYYLKESVDAAIDELKEKIDGQKWRGDEWARAANDKEKQIAELKAENRKLKRALWLARAERADDRARIFYFNDLETMLDIDGYSYDSKKKKGHKKLTARRWRIIWLKVERKCRAKAEELK
jgi:cell division septum initiation protein DivIVA